MKKYSKDYKLVPGTMKNGRLKEDVEYTGKYYVSRQSRTELSKKKTYSLLLSVCCVMILAGVGLLNTSGSRVFYIAVPYACMFLPSVFCMMGAVRSIRSGDRLEYAAYDKSIKRIFRSTVGSVIINVIVVIGDFRFLFSGLNSSEMRSEIIFLAGMFLLLLLSILHLRIQKEIVYESEDTVVS
jgi:hypothetical protein